MCIHHITHYSPTCDYFLPIFNLIQLAHGVMGKSYKGVLLTITISILLLGYHHYTEAKAWWSFPLYDDGLRSGEVGDKVIVMGRLASEDTSWVAENLPKYTSTQLIVVSDIADIW